MDDLTVRGRFGHLLQEIELPLESIGAILAAIDRSTDAIHRARAELANDDQLKEQGLDFIAFGSLARYEMTTSSDLDYLLVGKNGGDNEFAHRVALDSVEKLRQGMIDGVTLSEPGKSGLFGAIIDPDEITQAIGLQADTNHSLSRRILFLEESVSLFNPSSHEALLGAILGKYLELRKIGSTGVPRTLLNDILRYWRTIAVDYHAKSALNTPYSLRYLKLLIPRKLCFVSSVAPLYLMSHCLGEVDELAFLKESFSQPPIVRLGRLLSAISQARYSDSEQNKIIAREMFGILNKFIKNAGDASWREVVAVECGQEDPCSSDNFGQMRSLGKELHGHIGAIFTSEAMLPFTKEYMLS